MLAIIAFIIILGLLVFVHEAGHFIVAKRAGMAVEEFGFGFPPRIIGVQHAGKHWHLIRGSQGSPLRSNSAGQAGVKGQVSSTVYSLNWIPLGGFVRITGENGDASDPRSFAAKSRHWRALVLVAGVAMNVVLAVALFAAVAWIGAPQVLDGEVPVGARVRNLETRVVRVLAESPAAAVGIQPGDAIAAVDGQPLMALAEIQQYIRSHAADELAVTLRRDSAERTVRVRPTTLAEVSQPGIGVQLVATGTVSFPLHRALLHGVRTTGAVTVEIVRNLGMLFHGLIAERRVAVDVAGPVGIAVMTGQVIALGFVYLIQFAAVLSVNLALLNAIPFPALDGGRLLLLAIEAIRRRPIGANVERVVHSAGFAVLILIVLAVTYRDIAVFGGTIVGSIRSAVGW